MYSIVSGATLATRSRISLSERRKLGGDQLSKRSDNSRAWRHRRRWCRPCRGFLVSASSFWLARNSFAADRRTPPCRLVIYRRHLGIKIAVYHRGRDKPRHLGQPMTIRFRFPAGSLPARFASLPGGRKFPAARRRNCIRKCLIYRRLSPKSPSILRSDSRFFPVFSLAAGKIGPCRAVVSNGLLITPPRFFGRSGGPADRPAPCGPRSARSRIAAGIARGALGRDMLIFVAHGRYTA